MGFLDKLFGRGGGADKEARGEDVASRLDALAQLNGHWSTERIRRRVRDVFFAVQRSWIERDPAVGEPFMTEQLVARQRLRIEGLVRQHRVHQFENPLIEDLDFVSYDEGDPNTIDEPRVTTLLDVSLVETILNAETGAARGRAAERTRCSARSTGPSCGATASGCSTTWSSRARARAT